MWPLELALNTDENGTSSVLTDKWRPSDMSRQIRAKEKCQTGFPITGRRRVGRLTAISGIFQRGEEM